MLCVDELDGWGEESEEEDSTEWLRQVHSERG